MRKKASKLGFTSLYAYFEDKILKEKQAIEDDRNKELRKLILKGIQKRRKKAVAVVKINSW